MLQPGLPVFLMYFGQPPHVVTLSKSNLAVFSMISRGETFGAYILCFLGAGFFGGVVLTNGIPEGDILVTCV